MLALFLHKCLEIWCNFVKNSVSKANFSMIFLKKILNQTFFIDICQNSEKNNRTKIPYFTRQIFSDVVCFYDVKIQNLHENDPID